MALEVRWSAEAAIQLDEVISYLQSNWSQKELRQFFSRLEESIKAIAQNPHSFKNSSRKAGVKEFQVTKHNTIFYTFDDKNVFIVTFWANKKLLK